MVLALAGCGGGDGDGGSPDNVAPPPPPPPAAEAAGFYSGTTSTGAGSAIVVFEDGSYYAFYADGDQAYANGVVVGTGTAKNGSFSSTDARDFNADGVRSATVSASYVTKKSLNGSIAYTAPTGTNTFTSTYESSYERTPTLSGLAGTYSGVAATTAGDDTLTATIAASGAITGTSGGGCSITGTVTPKSKGYAFDVKITFGAAPCVYPGLQVTGIAVQDTDEDQTPLVLAVGTSSDKTKAVIFTGAKPAAR